MSETRHRIHDHVDANAGVHFNELVRETAFAPGQIQYHIRQLTDDGRVVRDQFYGRTHYYPPTYDPWERATLALFRRETAREIIVTLIDFENGDGDGNRTGNRDHNAPARPATVAANLDIARSTLEWHLERLCEQAVVEKHYDERGRVTLHLADPQRTGRLLSRVTPSGPDRLVDRFTRLVDRLLEGSE